MDHAELERALLQAFQQEAPDLIDSMQAALFDLEAADKSNLASRIDALKRPIHSLKGAASAIGSTAIRDLCHQLEESLVQCGDGKIDAARMDLFHEAANALKRNLAQPLSDTDITPLVARLAALTVPVTTATPGSAVSLQPSANETGSSVTLATEAAVTQPGSDAKSTITASEVQQSIRVSISKIENLQSINGEIVSMRLRQAEHTRSLRHIRDDAAAFERRYHLLNNHLRTVHKQLDRRNAIKMDGMLSELSSQLRALKRELFRLSTDMTNQNGQWSLLSEAMDDGIRSMRMMPVTPFLESFKATARDAARMLEKQVKLVCRENDVELDRLIIEDIKDPLAHLVRNAVSHGIEPAPDRTALGKPPQGTITLSAELEGEFVLIRVSDDGAGFDLDRITRKAISKGLLSEGEIRSSDELLNIICMPGFSTSDSADLVSGRGVGMDVVAAMVSSLGGSLSLSHAPGQGSNFELRLPATLATTNGLILSLGSQQYGIILDNVERIERCTIADLKDVDGHLILYIEGQPVSVVCLENLLQPGGRTARAHDSRYPLVIIRAGVQRLAIMVDDIPGEIPVVVKPLGAPFAHLQMLSGGSILPDGRILPIIDARQAIASVSQRPSMRLHVKDAEPVNPTELPDSQNDVAASILVVDDSITTRTLERNILEACGYRVSVATDGLEALDILNVEDHIAMVVTDMEMPRMNGIELCRNIRAGRHNHLPIVMVTSVGDEAEKQKGLDAGADAYIIKGNFQQDHFLSTIRRFLHG